MEMAGRGFSGSYRFGYQGSEKDNEVTGDGNSYTTEFRQLDPRLGRWFSVDPWEFKYPFISPYASMFNNPINLNDPRGLGEGDGQVAATSGDGAIKLYNKALKLNSNLTKVEFAAANAEYIGVNSNGQLYNKKTIKIGQTFNVPIQAVSPSVINVVAKNTVSEDLVKTHVLAKSFNRELLMGNIPSSDSRVAAFVVDHPKIAEQIGKYEYGSNKISTSVVRFQQNTGLPGKHSNKRTEGTHQNAFRHALWQATITRKFGAKIAKEIGDAHEDVNNLNPLQSSYTDILMADEDADLRNNIIGRHIGSQNPNANMKELALKVLVWQYNNGLYNAVLQPDGKTYIVQVVRLTAEQYHKAINVINTTDEFGRTPEDQKKYNDMMQMELKAAEGSGLGF